MGGEWRGRPQSCSELLEAVDDDDDDNDDGDGDGDDDDDYILA